MVGVAADPCEEKRLEGSEFQSSRKEEKEGGKDTETNRWTLTSPGGDKKESPSGEPNLLLACIVRHAPMLKVLSKL